MAAPKQAPRPPRGRPRLAAPVRAQVTLYLRPGVDDDLLAWWQSLPAGRRAAAVKAALRAGGGDLAALAAGPDDDDLTGDLLAGGLVF